MQNLFGNRAGFIDRGADSFFERKNGGQELFFSKKRGAGRFFILKNGGQLLFSEGKKGGKSFFYRSQNGASVLSLASKREAVTFFCLNTMF